MSTHLLTPAVISSMGKSRSQDYSRPKKGANDDDGSRNKDKNKEPTLSSIAEEILDILNSRTSPSKGEYEIAASRLPVLETVLVSSDMVRPGSSKEFLYNYRAKRA